MKPILPNYDVINKVRNLEQGKESIREYYERINNSFIVELGYRDRTKDVTLSEGELIWLAFVIEKWIRGVKSTRLFDYLANKLVKNLFDAYIIAERKMLKEERESRQKKERKLQKEYQVALQELQEFVDRGLVNNVSIARTQKSYGSPPILEEQQSILKEINAAVDIADIETFAKPTASESVKRTIAPTCLQKSLSEVNFVDESLPILEQMPCNLSEINVVVDNCDTESTDEVLASGPGKWIAAAAGKEVFDSISTPAGLSKNQHASHVEATDEVLASGPGKWIAADVGKEVFGSTSTSDEASKNAIESASDNSFGWSRCCTVDDVEVLNQKVFALAALYDAFLKNPLVEDMEISVAMDMPSLKHLMDMDGPAIEAFDFGTTLGAHSKNSSAQHIEDSETSEKDSVFIYELPALPAFDLSIDIDFQTYTADSVTSEVTYSIIEASVMPPKRKLQLSSFRGLALRNTSFGWSRCCTISVGRRTSSVSICTFVSDVSSISTATSIECATTTVEDTNFCEREQSVSFCFVDSLDSASVDVISTSEDTDFYGGEQSFCSSVDNIVDDVCTFVVVVDIDALILIAGSVNTTKNSARMSFLGPIKYLAPKPKHKGLPKVKIKGY